MSVDEHDPLIGQVLLGKLDVLRVLGAGGMGSVYEVEHLITHHRRALKIIRPQLVARRTYMKRLIREAGVAGTLNTPYVVDTYDAGTLDDGSVYILMELLEGESLFDVIQREQSLGIKRLLAIASQLCEGVGVAHRAGIVHRDLKPDNIFLLAGSGGPERVKIMDFGISKFAGPEEEVSRLTSEGVVLGTPFYMSPEQARGQPLDGRTDLYSLGVLLYEALTGQLPFHETSVSALFIKIAAGEYAPLRDLRPEVPAGLAAVVAKAMHRKRDERYAGMEELRAALMPYASVETKVRATTLSDHPAPSRLTAGYEDAKLREDEPPRSAPLPPRESPPTELMGPATSGSDEPHYPSGSPERPLAAPADVVRSPGSRLRWPLIGAAAFALAIVAAVLVHRSTDDTTARGAERTLPREPTTDPSESPEAGLGEPWAPEPPREATAPGGADPAPTPPVAEETTAASTPEPAPPEEAEPRPTMSSSAMNGSRTTPVREPTAAERAGLELSPYGP